MKISKMSELKRAISDAINDYEEKDYPVELIFNEAMEFPTFKICVHHIKSNFFIDKNGTKWIKTDES